MAKLEFRGACTTNPIPFTESDEINEDEYRRHIDFMIDGGVRMLMPGPMVGNGVQLSEAERRRLIEITVDQVDGRIGVFPCCYVPAGTANTIAFIKELTEIGADGAYLPTPILWQCGPEAIYQHNRAILAETDLPVIYYSCPDTTGTALPSTVVERLLDEFPDGRILGYKQHVMSELPFDIARLAHRIPIAPACLDRFTLAGLQQGCSAQITIGGALVPEVVSGVFEKWGAGDRDGAKALFERYLPFFHLPPMDLIFHYRDYYSGTYYHILTRLGFEFGKPRLPYLWPIPDDLRYRIDEVMDELELPVGAAA